MITKEQEKDLILMKPEELAAGRVFYRKDKDGFATCILSEFEFQYFKYLTEQFFKENILFRRKNKPFQSFA